MSEFIKLIIKKEKTISAYAIRTDMLADDSLELRNSRVTASFWLIEFTVDAFTSWDIHNSDDITKLIHLLWMMRVSGRLSLHTEVNSITRKLGRPLN